MIPPIPPDEFWAGAEDFVVGFPLSQSFVLTSLTELWLPSLPDEDVSPVFPLGAPVLSAIWLKP